MTQIRTFHARLDTLLGNAKSADPADVADFDWENAGRITGPRALDFLAKTVNRLYHGELATAAACAALAPRMDDPLVREFLEHQAADEERHARIYRRYMHALGIAPVEEPVSAEILGAVDRPNVTLQYDSYHAQVIHGDALTVWETYGHLVGHIQLGDAPGRCEPGRGEIDFAALFEAIRGSGYNGWMSAEYRPTAARTDASLDWRALLG